MEHHRLASAKKQLLNETRSEDWCVGVGIAKVDADVGLMLSVKPGTRPAARGLLKKLAMEVPVQIREVGTIRPRLGAGRSAPPAIESGDLARLRAAVARRSGK